MLQQLALSDMAAAAHIHRIAFDRALPALAGLHTPERIAVFSASASLPNASCGALGGAGMIGMIAFRKDWIDQLYVLPEVQGQGIGSSLFAARANFLRTP